MDIHKIVTEEGTDDDANPAYALSKQVAVRLERLIGEWLTDDESVALMGILVHEHFRCDDGFMINGSSDLYDEPSNALPGLRSASFVAAAFSQSPDIDADFVWNEYMTHGTEPKYVAAKTALIQRILADRSVEHVNT